jgi:hypothetical protein
MAAGDSGIDPAIVYAMNKTSRIVSEINVHFLTEGLWMVRAYFLLASNFRRRLGQGAEMASTCKQGGFLLQERNRAARYPN